MEIACEPAHFLVLLTTLGGHFAVLIVDGNSLRTGPLFSAFGNLARLGRVSLSSRDEKVRVVGLSRHIVRKVVTSRLAHHFRVKSSH